MRPTIVLIVGVLASVAASAGILAGPSALLPGWLRGSDIIEAGGTRGLVDGWVSKLDTEAGVVHVARHPFHLSGTSVTIGADTDIRIHDKIGSIADLREGVHLKICYDVRDGRRSARAIDVPPSPGPCRVITTHAPEVRPDEEPTATSPVNDANAVPRTRPAVVEPARGRPAALRTSATPPRASTQSAPALGVKADAPAGAAPPVAPTPTTRETGDAGHDYGAIVDRVLRR